MAYRAVMGLWSVQEAYASLSEQYIAFVGGDRATPEPERSLIRRHLTDVPGPVFDLGCGPGHWTAYLYRWPVDVFAEHLAEAGFTEVERLRQRFPERPDRRYAALAARAP